MSSGYLDKQHSLRKDLYQVSKHKYFRKVLRDLTNKNPLLKSPYISLVVSLTMLSDDVIIKIIAHKYHLQEGFVDSSCLLSGLEGVQV